MKTSSLAILLTCYNRKQKTLDCLSNLFEQSLPEEIQLSVYLVDDGSTDGTTEAVQQKYPHVNVLQGDGSLFWTGGMQLAFAEAIRHSHNFYLWLNDDTILYPTAIKTLLTTFDYAVAKVGNLNVIVAGATQDPDSGVLTYGGVLKGHWTHPCRFHWLKSIAEPQPCDTMNGNCVLISHQAAELVGGLDLTFRHYAADFDYGLRAKQRGGTVWMAPGYVGTCVYNHPRQQMQQNDSSLTQQVQKLEQPKGLATQDVTLHPFWEWKAFTERHAGLLWPLYWLLPYRRLVGLWLKPQRRTTELTTHFSEK